MLTFRYRPEIFTRYPKLRSGVLFARQVTNSHAPEPLQKVYLAEQRAVLEQISETMLSDLKELSAWRSVFRAFGVEPTKYRSAPEALLRRLTKKGDIPFINTIVDICNLVSIRYYLPTAAFDLRAIQGDVTVHFADGNERYIELGQEAVNHPDPGEVVFTDETSLVIARRWCWRQSESGAAKLDTQDIFVTVEAVHPDGAVDAEAAVMDMVELFRQYIGGEFTWGLLDPQRQEISG